MGPARPFSYSFRRQNEGITSSNSFRENSGGFAVPDRAYPRTPDRSQLSVGTPERSRVAGILRRVFTRPRLVFVGTALVFAAVAVAFLVWLGLLGYYNLPYAVDKILPTLLTGAVVTLRLIALVIPLGFSLGFFFGWARTTNSFILRGAGASFVEFFRGMPPLVLIFFTYLTVTLSIRQITENPFLARDLSLLSGAVALAFHSGGYQAEIIRAGLLSVPTGQLEAADSLGMSRFQSMFRVVLPQAFRVSLPALGNEFASVIKDTSLLSVIGWADLAGAGAIIVPATLSTPGLGIGMVLVMWIEVALIYFVITFIVARTVRSIENAFKVPGLEAAEL